MSSSWDVSVALDELSLTDKRVTATDPKRAKVEDEHKDAEFAIRCQTADGKELELPNFANVIEARIVMNLDAWHKKEDAKMLLATLPFRFSKDSKPKVEVIYGFDEKTESFKWFIDKMLPTIYNVFNTGTSERTISFQRPDGSYAFTLGHRVDSNNPKSARVLTIADKNEIDPKNYPFKKDKFVVVFAPISNMAMC